MVGCRNKVDKAKLTSGTRVALDMTTLTIMRALPREYRYEPRLALAGRGDGLALVRAIIAQAAGHLEPRGLLVCEIGDGRAKLERAFPRVPFAWPQTAAGTGQLFLVAREDLQEVG